ncbi:MAG: DUF4258 domain-containing protein [Polyangiaceae bacterium]
MGTQRVIEEVRGYAAARRIWVSSHGRQRMSERGVTYEDLRYALMNAESCEEGVNGRWKLCSNDMSGDPLTAVVVLQDGLILVTVY